MTAPEFAGLADDLIKDEELAARGDESWWHFEVRAYPDQGLPCSS